MSQSVVLGAALIGAYYLYISQKPESIPVPAETPDIYKDNERPQEQPVLTDSCPEFYKLSEDGTECVLDGRINTCPDGYKLNEAGDQCIASETGDLDIGLPGTIGVGIGSSIIMDTALNRALAEAAKKKAAAEAAEKAAKETAEKAAKEAAEKATAEKATKLAWEKSEKEAAEKAAKEAAIAQAKASAATAKSAKASATAAKATKATQMMSKIKGTPWDFIITIIAQTLIAVLDLSEDSFEKCKDGEFDFSSMPDWAKAIVSAVPIVGNLFDLLSPVLCMKNSCEPPYENQNGLCYAPAQAGFKCEAFQCYKQYPDFENNGLGHTLNNITKAVRSDVGKSILEVGSCPSGFRKVGELCFRDPGASWDIDGLGIAAENCNPGETETALLCSWSEMEPCPSGSKDIAGTCWGVVEDRICADDCSKGWDGCRRRGALGECVGGCREGCSSSYREAITMQLHERKLAVKTRTRNTMTIPSQEMDCPAGMDRLNGMCYDKPPPGFSRKTQGTIEQDCPPGSKDIGVACEREQYNRGAGVIPIGVRMKSRKAQQEEDPIPPLCSDVNMDGADPNNLRLCRMSVCADDEELQGDFCVSKCKPLYRDQGDTCFRPAGIVDPISGQPFAAEDSYQKREPRPVDWGFF